MFAVSFTLLCSLNCNFKKWLSVSPTLGSCLDLNSCSKELYKGHNKVAWAALSCTHPCTYSWLSKGYCHCPQVTTSCSQTCANHATTTRPLWQTEPILLPHHALHCSALHQQRGWDAETAGCSVPVATLQPNTKLFPKPLAARAWKHPFSLLFKHEAPSHKRRHSCLQKVSVCGLWPALNQLHSSANPSSGAAPLWLQIRRNAEQEPDINLLLKGNI